MMVDFPIGADGTEQRSIDIRAHEPDIDNLRGRLDSIVPFFCANPGCIHAFCPRHGMLLFWLTTCWFRPINAVQEFPPVQSTAPRVTSDGYPEGESCGGMCFREIDDTFGVMLPNHLPPRHCS